MGISNGIFPASALLSSSDLSMRECAEAGGKCGRAPRHSSCSHPHPRYGPLQSSWVWVTYVFGSSFHLCLVTCSSAKSLQIYLYLEYMYSFI